MADPQLNNSQFAAKIKQKYPQYAGVPDDKLVSAVLAKYPQYKDRVLNAQDPNGRFGVYGTGEVSAPKTDILSRVRSEGEDLRNKLTEFAGKGQPPKVTEFMESLPLGLSKTVTGTARVLQGHPYEGGKEALGGAVQALTIPSAFVAPEAEEAIGGALPSGMKARAGQLFESVAKDANKVPVDLKNSGDAILKLMDWQRKTQLGPTINKFLNRITSPKAGPLTYEEGRDFYQLLGKLSAEEKLKVAPAANRSLAQMVSGMKTDIGDAAGRVGRAADYYKAMGNYAKAEQYQKWLDIAEKYGIKAALKIGGGMLTGLGFREAYGNH